MLASVVQVGFTQTVEQPAIPEVSRLIHEEDFTDGVISNHWVIDSSGGSVIESDGVMNITRSNDVEKTNAFYYLNEDKTDMQGLIGVEFTAKRDKPAKTLNIRVFDSDDNAYIISAIRNGKLNVSYSESADVDGSNHALKEGNWKEFKINLLFDTENSTYSMWFDDECVVNNKYSSKNTYI